MDALTKPVTQATESLPEGEADAPPASIENVYWLVAVGEFESALEIAAELGAA